jgi:BirA family biotin operon repressor/biotin-[acetyl-CoA-carboxylase] ligase
VGRGRGANQWTDSEGALLATFSFDSKQALQPILVPLTGLALYQAASTTWPHLHWALKSPNDIYLGDKKIAGILIEAIERGNERRVMIGIGMNVLSHPAVVPTATSLAEQCEASEKISNEIWLRFLDRLFDGLKSAVLKGQAHELEKADSDAIRDALNRRPGLPEPI